MKKGEAMCKINLLILDVLKPHKPDIMELCKDVTECTKNISVNARVVEIDEKTESIQLIVKGENIDLEKIKETIEKLGASIHSIDEISMGYELISSKEFARIN